jgi:CDP-diacylglycerol--serine O-phosphatidyltransferase
MIRFIGFYDYTVILTYLSLISSVFGITQAIHGDYKMAILCLGLSGVCDAFDGRVARSKKNRTEDEKNFGIQLDSLCDVICFGVFPALICYYMGAKGPLGLAIVFFYSLCAVIRLAFFNVLEIRRQHEEDGGCAKTYRGLPVTSISVILPLFFLLQYLIPDTVFGVLLYVLPAVVGFLFIFDFSLPKPGLRGILIMIGLVAVTVVAIFAISKLKAEPSNRDNGAADTTIGEHYEANNP